MHLCVWLSNGYRNSLNSRKITLAITKPRAPCRSASKIGEESRAAIQMLLLEKHRLQRGRWDPPRAPGTAGEGWPGTAGAAGMVPSGEGCYRIKHMCQYALDFSATCRSLT